MDTKDLIKQINTLSEELKHEAVHFAEFLLLKSEKSTKGKLRPYGLQKSQFFRAKDFNEPLESFKDYM